MPEQVRIVAVQVADVTTFAERCTPEVEAAVDEAYGVVRRLVGG